MTAIQEKWTDDQREAVAIAYVDLGIRPYRHLAALCADGKLAYNGRFLDPFEMPVATIKTCVQRLRRQRAGDVASEIADHPDAAGLLRKRLLAMADAELRALNRQPPGKRDMERHRQIARAVREAAAIPLHGTGVKPGDRNPETGERESGVTRGGLGEQIRKAAARTGTAPPPPEKEEGREDGALHSDGSSTGSKAPMVGLLGGQHSESSTGEEEDRMVTASVPYATHSAL